MALPGGAVSRCRVELSEQRRNALEPQELGFRFTVSSRAPWAAPQSAHETQKPGFRFTVSSRAPWAAPQSLTRPRNPVSDSRFRAELPGGRREAFDEVLDERLH